MIAGRLTGPEFGYSSTTVNYCNFLNLPIAIVSTSLIHYIAHFRGQNDEARLQGLLAGCQRFLFFATIAGSIVAVIVAEPVARFFGFRTTLMLVGVVYILVNLWSGFAVALCQGMAWFKRIAIIALVAVGMKVAFAWVTTRQYPTAEMAVSATIFSLLANLSLLYWWKDIFRHGAQRISPWNKEFVHFLLVTGAYVAGNYFFLQGDSMVAQKFFPPNDLGEYLYANKWAVALPLTVAPLLLVMFTSRSGGNGEHASSDQRILLSLYTVGMICGAGSIIVLRSFLIRILAHHDNPHAASMLIPYTVTMTFVGLGQAIAMWSLASRWFRLAIVYGAFGLIYWITLLLLGHTPETLLRIMPIGTGATFFTLLAGWLLTFRSRASGEASA